MNISSRTPDPLDRLLAGDESVEAALLAVALGELRADFAEEPTDAVASAHLAAITTAAAEAAHTAPAVASAGAVARWRMRVRSVLGLTVVKVGFSVGIAAAASGMAATGTLPAPVQRAVVDVADRIGFELPAPAADRAATAGDPPGDTPAGEHDAPRDGVVPDDVPASDDLPEQAPMDEAPATDGEAPNDDRAPDPDEPPARETPDRRPDAPEAPPGPGAGSDDRGPESDAAERGPASDAADRVPAADPGGKRGGTGR